MLKRSFGFALVMTMAPLSANERVVAPQTTALPGETEKDEYDGLTPEMIQAQKDRYERLTIPVTIGGNGPYRFMVDTGAQATVVSRTITEELDLPKLGNATLVAMGSRREVELAQLDGLEFGGRLFDNLEAPILERRNVGADGILGLDSLQDSRVLIDFREDRIFIADADDGSSNRGYEIVVRARQKLGQMIITDARVDGIKVAVIIDTGAENTVANQALRNRMRSRSEIFVQSTDVNGVMVLGNLGWAKKMNIGGVELTGVPISFADSPAFAALDLEDKPTIILGMRNLQNFDRIAIDFSSRKVLFDLPSGAYNVNPYNRTFFPSRIPGS